MKSISRLRIKDTQYFYSTSKAKKELLDANLKNEETLCLWNNILKNDDIIDAIIFACIIKNSCFKIAIEAPFDSEEDIKIYELNKKNLPSIINYVCNNLKLNNKELKNIKTLLESMMPDFIMTKLDYPIQENISIGKVIDAFKQNITREQCQSLFHMEPEQLCDIITQQPFNFINQKKNSDTILERLLMSEEEKLKIKSNIFEFKYKYELDRVSQIILKTTPEFTENITLNEGLKSELLEELPEKFSKTQKIYYIYRRLCQILTYDESYYAGNQKRTYLINHNMPQRISLINESNNIVVCFEVAIILACFCDELGIPYKMLSYDMIADIKKYGKQHLNLEIKSDEYLIRLDPTTGLINSDLAYEKTKGYVQCFWAANKTQRTQDKFDEELIEVDKYINLKSMELGYDMIQKNILKLQLKTYEQETVEERIGMLVDIILKNHLSKVDSLRYILDCYRAIFPYPYSSLVRVEFTSYYEKINERRIPKVVYLIVYNSNNLDHDTVDNKYYCIIDDKLLVLNRTEYIEMKNAYLMSKIDASDAKYEDDDDALQLIKKN